MKRISLVALMIISLGITIYTVIFWQPSENIMVGNKIQNEIDDDTSVEVQNNIEESANVENTNLKEESNIDDVSVVVVNDILKVEESEMKRLLTKDEKKRIDNIIKKMSSVDLNNLKEKFNSEDRSKGFKEGFALIRTRVSISDYEEMKEILSEYIDFNILDIEV